MRNAAVAAMLVLVAVTAIADTNPNRFPRPEFETDYRHPEVQHVMPRSDVLETADVALLAVLLALAAYFALSARSRRGLFGIGVVSVVYFGFVRAGCVCPVGSIQNVAAALFVPGEAIPVVVIALFVLPLAFALFFGRVFCGGVCPLGAVQDLVMLKPLKVPRRLAEALATIPYLYLGVGVLLAATGSVYLICRYDPFVSFFRFGGDASMMVYSGGFLLLAVVVARPYCRFLCPYGVLLGWMSFLATKHLRTNPENCLSCRLCEEACAMDCIDQPSSGEIREPHASARRRLGLMLLLIPVVAGVAGFVTSRLDERLAQMHPQAHLAARLEAEDAGEVRGTTLASAAFRATGVPREELLAEVAEIEARFATGGWFLGVFFGVVVMVKLIRLSVYRTREAFQPNPVSCFSCGRCFAYCPQEKPRIQIEGVSS